MTDEVGRSGGIPPRPIKKNFNGSVMVVFVGLFLWVKLFFLFLS